MRLSLPSLLSTFFLIFLLISTLFLPSYPFPSYFPYEAHPNFPPVSIFHLLLFRPSFPSLFLLRSIVTSSFSPFSPFLIITVYYFTLPFYRLFLSIGISCFTIFFINRPFLPIMALLHSFCTFPLFFFLLRPISIHPFFLLIDLFFLLRSDTSLFPLSPFLPITIHHCSLLLIFFLSTYFPSHFFPLRSITATSLLPIELPLRSITLTTSRASILYDLSRSESPVTKQMTIYFPLSDTRLSRTLSGLSNAATDTRIKTPN